MHSTAVSVHTDIYTTDGSNCFTIEIP